MKILFKKRESPSRACEGTYISYVWAREGAGGGFIITSPPAGETGGGQHLASSPLGKSGGYRPGGDDPPPKSRRTKCRGIFLACGANRPGAPFAEGFYCPARARAPAGEAKREFPALSWHGRIFLACGANRPGAPFAEGVSCPVLARTVFRSSSQRF